MAPKGPHYQATRDQQDKRVEAVVEMLTRYAHKSQVKASLREFIKKHENVDIELSSRQCEVYIARARDKIRKSMQPEYQAQRYDQAIAVYESILRDPDSKPIVRLKAQERIDALFGYEPPKQTVVMGAGGAPLIPTADQEAIDRVYGDIARLRGAQAQGDGNPKPETPAAAQPADPAGNGRHGIDPRLNGS